MYLKTLILIITPYELMVFFRFKFLIEKEPYPRGGGGIFSLYLKRTFFINQIYLVG